MMSEAPSVPFRIHSCSAKCSERPAEQLVGGRGPWRSDIPVPTALLRIEFDHPVTVAAVRVVNSVSSHIEIKSEEGDLSAPLLVTRKTVIGRTQLREMLPHKLVGEDSERFGEREHLLKPVAPVTTNRLRITVLSMWEPTTHVGLDSVEVLGFKAAKVAATRGEELFAAALKGKKPAPKPESQDSKADFDFIPDVPKAAPVASTPPPTASAVPGDAMPAKRVKKEPSDAAPASAPPGETTGKKRTPLDGVVLVLSGYQNPLRGQLRDKAVALGAVVVNDWGPVCTHLICVAPNTPKYHQVISSGHGYVVTKAWLDDCDKDGKRHDERNYRLTAGGGTGGGGGTKLRIVV